MTFNDDANIKSGRVSRRGRNTGLAVGGGGLGIVAIFLVGQLLGVDLSGLVDPGAAPGPVQETSLDQCATGEDANENLDCRMKARRGIPRGVSGRTPSTAPSPPRSPSSPDR